MREKNIGRNRGENRHVIGGNESREETAVVENGAGKKPSKGQREKMEEENKKYEEGERGNKGSAGGVFSWWEAHLVTP